MASGVCKFCGMTRELRQSHIIPEFLYRPLYDSKHRVIAYPADSPAGYLQKGYRASLLCDACEQSFNENFEKPFKKLFVDKPMLPKIAFRKEYKVNVRDYSSVKLFLLSVLWRAGVCSEEPFDKVDLGNHEPTIRAMLETRNPGGAGDYPIFAYLGLAPDSHEVAPFVVQPYRMGELEGSEIWVFIFGGCMWHFVLSTGAVPKLLVNNVLETNGDLVVPTVDTWNVQALNRYFMRHFKAAEARGEL